MADLDSFFAKKDKKKVKGKKFTTTDEIARRLEETEKKLEQQQGNKTKVLEPVKKLEENSEDAPVVVEVIPKKVSSWEQMVSQAGKRERGTRGQTADFVPFSLRQGRRRAIKNNRVLSLSHESRSREPVILSLVFSEGLNFIFFLEELSCHFFSNAY